MTGRFAFLFDLDGVLVNTLNLHYLSWRHVAEQTGRTFNEDDMHRFQGRRRDECLAEMFYPHLLSASEAEAYLTMKNDHYLAQLEAIKPEALIAPYVTQVIDQVRAAGLKIGVASSSMNAVPVLRRVGLYDAFGIVADGNAVVRAKPHPDIFLWTAGALHVHPAQAVVFEDSLAGITAARACGMYTVGVGSSAEVHQAHQVIPDFEAVSIDQIIEAAQQQINVRVVVGEEERDVRN